MSYPEEYDTAAGKPVIAGALFGSVAVVAFFLCLIIYIWGKL